MAKRVSAVKQGRPARGGSKQDRPVRSGGKRGRGLRVVGPAGTGPGMTERDDEKKGRGLRGRAGRMRGGRGSGRTGAGQVRFWGRHAIEAALLNPERVHRKLWATREAVASLASALGGELPADFTVEYASVVDLARLVARDAPHQGLVLDCAPLEELADRKSVV